METVVISRHGGAIFYNRMKFWSNPFSLSKVNESSSWFSYLHSTHTVCKMKTEKSFEIRDMTLHLLTSVFLSKTSSSSGKRKR